MKKNFPLCQRPIHPSTTKGFIVAYVGTGRGDNLLCSPLALNYPLNSKHFEFTHGIGDM